jgi:hypothetical protein
MLSEELEHAIPASKRGHRNRLIYKVRILKYNKIFVGFKSCARSSLLNIRLYWQEMAGAVCFHWHWDMVAGQAAVPVCDVIHYYLLGMGRVKLRKKQPSRPSVTVWAAPSVHAPEVSPEPYDIIFIILSENWSWKKYFVKVWTAFKWLLIGSGERLCKHRHKRFGSTKAGSFITSWATIICCKKVKVMLCLLLIKQYAMKAYGGVKVQLQAVLTSKLNGGQWSVSRSNRFTLEEVSRSVALSEKTPYIYR